MRKKHNAKKNVVVFSEGDFATLSLTGSERTSLDQRRILVKIYKGIVYTASYLISVSINPPSGAVLLSLHTPSISDLLVLISNGYCCAPIW